MCKVYNDNPANRRHSFIPSILKPSSNLFSGKFTTCTTFRIWVWLTNFKVSIQTMAFSRVQDSNYIIGTVCCFTRRKKVAVGFWIGKSLPREHVNGAKKGRVIREVVFLVVFHYIDKMTVTFCTKRLSACTLMFTEKRSKCYQRHEMSAAWKITRFRSKYFDRVVY